MKIWIVLNEMNYDGTYFFGAFETLEGAKTAADVEMEKRTYSTKKLAGEAWKEEHDWPHEASSRAWSRVYSTGDWKFVAFEVEVEA